MPPFFIVLAVAGGACQQIPEGFCQFCQFVFWANTKNHPPKPDCPKTCFMSREAAKGHSQPDKVGKEVGKNSAI